MILSFFGRIDTNEGRFGAMGNAPAFANSLIKLIEIYHRYNVDSRRTYYKKQCYNYALSEVFFVTQNPN